MTATDPSAGGRARDERAPAEQLDAADAALASAVTGDEAAPYDLDDLVAETGATRTLLESVARTGLLLPSSVDETGRPRYSDADADAVRAGLVLLEAGLPLGELLEIARRTDDAVTAIADAAVEAFLRFIRDPAHGTASTPEEAAARLVTAYQQMLPATERLVAHHLRRRLLRAAAERVLGADDAEDPRASEPDA
jgi:DNA-binding transcriptional MerR regulator